MKNVIILGSGNWGTTLALEFSHRCQVRLWTRSDASADCINAARENSAYLPGVPLPEAIRIEAKFSSPIAPEDWVIIAVPSSRMLEICGELKPHIHPGQVIINVSKGVVSGTVEPLNQLIQKQLGEVSLVVLSGPTIAREIAAGEPARAVLSCRDTGTLLDLKKNLDLPHLSFEMSHDVKGTELCAALKGIVGIGVGVADGLGLHANVQSVIMTYGLHEFRTIARFLEVPEKTIYGLSGMGDLITTCISPDSRNRRFGKMLGKGMKLEEALKGVGMVVEGVSMAKTIIELSNFNLNIPLFKCLTRIIFDSPADIYSELITTIKSIG